MNLDRYQSRTYEEMFQALRDMREKYGKLPMNLLAFLGVQDALTALEILDKHCHVCWNELEKCSCKTDS